MNGLHDGQLRRVTLAGSAVALVASAFVFAPPAGAETIGGDLLASAHRTVQLGPDAKPLPDVWAESWILADAGTGEVLAQKASHARRPPASTLKTLTALTVLPRTSLDQRYAATPRAAGIYGARVGLRVGKAYTMEQLWHAVFLPSANDAAIAVAEANGGVRRTVAQMNEVAAHLNARDTAARNPTGLDAPGQLSSAYDLALIARAGLQRPDFARFAATPVAQFPNLKGRKSHPIYTTNRLLLHGWKGTIGVKTGFTTKAGRTYVGAARRGGRTLLVALMGIHEPTERAAKKLLRWGFRNADHVDPIGVLVDPGPLAPDAAPGASPGAQPADESDSGPSGGSPITAASDALDARVSSAGVPVAGLVGVAAIATAIVVGAVAAVSRRRPRPPGP